MIEYNNYKNIIKKMNKYNSIIKVGLDKKIDNKTIIEKIINKNLISITKYNITLINSDFYIGFKLNRSNVYEYILNDCGLLCDYDPCIYQGVLIKFYWNSIKKIQDGTYGFCEETAEPIGLKRLMARPVATLCISAQEKHEKEEKVYADD